MQWHKVAYDNKTFSLSFYDEHGELIIQLPKEAVHGFKRVPVRPELDGWREDTGFDLMEHQAYYWVLSVYADVIEGLGLQLMNEKGQCVLGHGVKVEYAYRDKFDRSGSRSVEYQCTNSECGHTFNLSVYSIDDGIACPQKCGCTALPVDYLRQKRGQA